VGGGTDWLYTYALYLKRAHDPEKVKNLCYNKELKEAYMDKEEWSNISLMNQSTIYGLKKKVKSFTDNIPT